MIFPGVERTRLIWSYGILSPSEDIPAFHARFSDESPYSTFSPSTTPHAWAGCLQLCRFGSTSIRSSSTRGIIQRGSQMGSHYWKEDEALSVDRAGVMQARNVWSMNPQSSNMFWQLWEHLLFPTVRYTGTASVSGRAGSQAHKYTIDSAMAGAWLANGQFN